MQIPFGNSRSGMCINDRWRGDNGARQNSYLRQTTGRFRWIFSKGFENHVIGVIEIIDLFLVGTIAYITAIGIYKLFIDKSKIQLPVKIKINNLSDLENKIIGIIIAALAVAFLGKAAGTDDTSALLNYGGGIALVIAALSVFMKFNNVSKKKDESN